MTKNKLPPNPQPPTPNPPSLEEVLSLVFSVLASADATGLPLANARILLEAAVFGAYGLEAAYLNTLINEAVAEKATDAFLAQRVGRGPGERGEDSDLYAERGAAGMD